MASLKSSLQVLQTVKEPLPAILLPQDQQTLQPKVVPHMEAIEDCKQHSASLWLPQYKHTAEKIELIITYLNCKYSSCLGSEQRVLPDINVYRHRIVTLQTGYYCRTFSFNDPTLKENFLLCPFWVNKKDFALTLLQLLTGQRCLLQQLNC